MTENDKCELTQLFSMYRSFCEDVKREPKRPASKQLAPVCERMAQILGLPPETSPKQIAKKAEEAVHLAWGLA